MSRRIPACVIDENHFTGEPQTIEDRENLAYPVIDDAFFIVTRKDEREIEACGFRSRIALGRASRANVHRSAFSAALPAYFA